ncbi:MAG: hypothetical protein IJ548_07785 [Paludibacteraceae bacterium]|nr:hypothetical protein [Paludibacteraceae bacterium]MBQ8713812.1 hypothetical protein [Prevotella sp.]
MNHKKIIGLWLLLLMPLALMAKDKKVSYVVSKVSGRVELITPKGKHRVEKGDVLTADATIDVSFSGSMTLLAENSNKQYVINAPGKAKLESFLADKRNTVLTLTEDYVKSVVAQLRKEKSVKVRRHSDPATVTREQLVKDTLFQEKDLNDSLMTEKADTTQCQN